MSARKFQQMMVLNDGAKLWCVAMADDGTLWQAIVAASPDGVRFQRPSRLANTVAELHPGWTEVAGGMLPDHEVDRAAFFPPQIEPMKMPEASQ